MNKSYIATKNSKYYENKSVSMVKESKEDMFQYKLMFPLRFVPNTTNEQKS